VPIAVPPGRKGMQPALGLAYSSSARNSWLGVGWSLDLGYIERSTKRGVPAYNSSDTYSFMFQGVTSELVQIPDGTYRAKDEGAFLRFERLGISGWEVRDTSGTRYLFGGTPASEHTNTRGTFRWCLRKVLDTNGNFLTISYVKDQNQTYPSRIDYTGHETGGLQDLAPANYVEFITESRPDSEVSQRSGDAVTTALRLKEIAAYAQGQLARKHLFAYAQSRRSGRSLLQSITQLGTDGVTGLPPTTFTYQEETEPTYSLSSNNPSVSVPAWNIQKAGLDTGHENFGCINPYAGLPWRPTVVVNNTTADLGCMNVTVNGDGSITVSGCQDTFLHAWTWVYLSSPQALSLSYTGSEACLWREDASGLQNFGNGGSIPFQSGWSIIHLVGYHQHSGWTNRMTSPLINLVDVMSPSQFIQPQLSGDVDGNGITDLITFDAVNGTWEVALSHGADFSPQTTWLTNFGGTSSTPLLGDWNADGTTDIATFNSGSWSFATSTAAGFQTGTIAPLSFGNGAPLTGDFNGDGRIDIGTYNSGAWSVALSSGSGFTAAGSFSHNLGDSAHDPLTGDFNGDGLTDIAAVAQSTGNIRVALSNGSAFVAQPSSWIGEFGPGNPHTSADFNGDGLTDAAYFDKSTGQVHVTRSTGTQFATPDILPITFSLRSADDSLQVGDYNGDGLADPAVFNVVTGASELAYSNGEFVDLLSVMNNGLGGSSSIAYQPSTQCDNICPIQGVPKLPFVLPVVSRITVDNGMGRALGTTYEFLLGRYDAPTREFRGFATVKVRDADGNVTISEFSQADDTKGRPFLVEFRDAFDNLWTRTTNTWTPTELFPGVRFAQLTQTDSSIYNGDASFRQIHQRFQYDPYGNVTAAYQDGEAGVTGDERSTVTTFTANESSWIVGVPALIQTLDATGAVVAQRRFYYDDSADYTAAPIKGSLTKEEEWLNGPTEQWLPTRLAYDAYGNVATVTDALNRTTTNTYDAQTFTYLTQITNTLGHSRQLAYDPRVGQVLSSTDQNNVTTTTEYDALGRVTKVIGPNDTAALPTVSYEYDLFPTPPSRSVVHTRIQSGQPEELTVYAFTDGLGRTIQTRSPAEDPSKQIVSGAIELDDRGLVIKQWAPYLEEFSSSYVPVSSPAPRPEPLAPPVVYVYDVAGRLLTATDPNGSVSSTSYDDWSVTTTDANNHSTRRSLDAYGRLIMVEEFNVGQTYTTTYAYDALDNLIQVDQWGLSPQGTVPMATTHVAYDSLGRKIAMDDPDMGVWTYDYDAVDNLTSQTDARGVTISFMYDALNRLKQKSYAIPQSSGISDPGTVTYTYDNPVKPFSKGKLTEIADGSGSSSFEYDNLGRLIVESKTIGGTTYTIHRAYDLLGRLTSLTYPDSEIVSYTYNLQGGIETIAAMGTGPEGGLSSTPLITNMDYNAAGQLTRLEYGNGVVTDYSYNPQTLRLDRLTSQGPSGMLQDFTYSFDPIGNVTQIVDSVHSGTQSFLYDDLNRLSHATGAYGTYTYAYDPLGNMIDKEGVAMQYGQNGAGPHAVTSTSAGLSLTYDANGNLTEKRPGSCDVSPASCSLSQLFEYDTENRISKVTTAQEETVSVTFKQGWNFFSLPVLPEDGRAVVLLPTFAQDFEQIAKFEPATGSYQHYVGNPKFDDFDALEYGVGYQVFATQEVTVEFRGQLPTQRLNEGLGPDWHLLPAIQLAPAAASSTFGGLDYDQLLALDADGQVLQPTSEVAAAQAYWIHLRSAGTFRPSLPRDPTTRFVYDGDGGRVKRTTSEGTTTYLGEVYEEDSTGTATKYIFAGDLRIATRDSTGGLRFYHTDHLGSSNALTDGTGQLAQLAEHSPFGAVSRAEAFGSTAPGSATPVGFTGQRQDTMNGLIIFPARAYDPQLGRFLQPDPFVQDPADPQTLNRYAYVRNNPINLVDPSGYFFGWDDLLAWLISAAVTAGVTYASWPFNKGFDPSILQDTGERFWTPLVPPIIQGVQPFSYIGTSIAKGVQELTNNTDEFLKSEAFQKLLRMGVSATAAALNLANSIKTNIVGMASTSVPAILSAVGPPSVKSGLRRFGSSVLGGIHKTLDASKWKDLWANAKYHQWGSLARTAWSGVQGIGLFAGGRRLVKPYASVGDALTVDQAQTISAIRGIRFTLVTYAAGLGGAAGFAVGGGPFSPTTSPITAGAGAALAGGMADFVLGGLERRFLNWAGLPIQ